MQFGCDSKIIPTWLNTMGIYNWYYGKLFIFLKQIIINRPDVE